MQGFQPSSLQGILIAILPLIFAITVHEVAHGRVAKFFGDNTAAAQGRLTLNPLKHIDPIGTILVPLVMIALLGFAFGWAKPVPVDWRNLRRPKRDMVFVAAAGPLANLCMALGWALLAKIGLLLLEPSDGFTLPLFYMGVFGVFINLLLMIFNLLPLPPLDGGRIAVGLLPTRWSLPLSRIEPYGIFILIGLMATGFLSWMFLFIRQLSSLILALFGLQ